MLPTCQVSHLLGSGPIVLKKTYIVVKQFQKLFFFFTIFGSILSSCDSRNLNLNTFCNLTLTSLAMWQPSVLETYGNLTTTYLNKTKGPLRPNYPNTMGDRELISSLTKVGWSSTSQIRTQSFITGSRVLQRLRKGHRHCEHLLRGTHGLW